MNFAYVGAIDLSWDLVLPVYLLAHNVGCEELRDLCVLYMKSRQVITLDIYFIFLLH